MLQLLASTLCSSLLLWRAEGIQSIGCFQDCGSSPDPSRDLSYLGYEDLSLIPGKCVAYCASRNYSYAGVQNGNQCFCGNNFGQVGGTWYTNNGGHSAVRGGNWADRLSDDYTVTDMNVCAARCLSDKRCFSAMLQTSGPGCVLFPYTCSQTGTSCPSWASYNWVGYWQKGGNPASPPQCNSACAGDSSQKCGGPCTNQIYSTAQPLTHMGCFADSNTRDLPFLIYGESNSYMTPQLCAYLCGPKYQYAGVQFSFQCFCGNSYGSQGASSNCNTACSGDSSQTCGGGYANNVYRIF